MALEDVDWIGPGIGPASLGVRLAHAADRREKPVVDVMLVCRDDTGKLSYGWSPMDAAQLAEMALFLETKVTIEVHWIWGEDED